MIGEEQLIHYVLIRDFNTFIYDHTLHRERKHFCSYCLQAFSTEEIIKPRINYCFKINDKQRIIVHKKVQYIKLKNYGRKTKLPFIIDADFESIFVPDDNENQNSKKPDTNKYQKHIAYSFGCKLLCVDDRFTKPFKTYLDKDAVYNFINNIIKESNYCSNVMKKHFKKELSMTKENI